MSLTKLVCALAVCLTASAPVLAQNRMTISSGMTIEEAAEAMRLEGAAAETSPSGDGGKISSSLSGVNFDVFAMNCNELSRCTEFLFIAGFDLPDGIAVERMNEWNARKLGGRAFIDQYGDPFLDHVVSVSGPGDVGAFREALYLWAASLDAFVEFIQLPTSSV